MIDMFFIFGAKYLFAASIILGAWWLWKLPKNKRREAVIFAAWVLPLSLIIAKIGSLLFFNPRPFVVGDFVPLIPHAPDNGFPSDHTLLVSAIATVVTFIDIRRSPWFWLIAIIVAVSRVGVGVHHPLDVTASAAIAATTAFIIHLCTKRYRKG